MRVLVSKPLKGPDIRITIKEGYTYKKIVEVLDENKLIDKTKFDSLINKEK